MSKTWYPVINYEECTECGSCFKKCSHGVFKMEGKRPVVVNPEGCVQGCHGCGNLCPVGAIEYVGDTTGWIAPGKQSCCGGNSDCCDNSGCCCSINENARDVKSVAELTGAMKNGNCIMNNPTGKCCHDEIQRIIDSVI